MKRTHLVIPLFIYENVSLFFKPITPNQYISLACCINGKNAEKSEIYSWHQKFPLPKYRGPSAGQEVEQQNSEMCI